MENFRMLAAKKFTYRSGLDGEKQDDARHHTQAELRPEGDHGQVAQANRRARADVRVPGPRAEVLARRGARLLRSNTQAQREWQFAYLRTAM